MAFSCYVYVKILAEELAKLKKLPSFSDDRVRLIVVVTKSIN